MTPGRIVEVKVAVNTQWRREHEIGLKLSSLFNQILKGQLHHLSTSFSAQYKHNTSVNIHYIYKSMWTPFQVSGFGYFSHTFADRCIKSSTQPCNLHGKTLAVDWPY
jgi:hypothetical protein